MCNRRRCASAFRLPALFAAVLIASHQAIAQTPPAPYPQLPPFDSSEAMIPMRDGVKLHTVILAPKGLNTDRPLVLTRTPYGAKRYATLVPRWYAEFAEEGYILVFQDIRGRFGSEGQFEELREPRDKRDPKATDESTDSYDTIDWLVKHVPHNNGRVGQLGASYDGWLTVMSALEPHPALKAVSPEASPASSYLGDDWYHNGAFRPAESFEYAAMMGRGNEMNRFVFDQYDTYSWWLKVGSLAHVSERILTGVPIWDRFAEHPNFDDYWQHEAVMPRLDSVRVPMLNVAGWWDAENFYGAVTIYRTLEPHDANHKNYLVIGPWNHGGWAHGSGQTLGAIDFGSQPSEYFRKNIQAPWFAYWLKDKGSLTLAEATVFETGANAWRNYDSWPPKAGVSPRKLYFGPNGTLSFDAPTDNAKDAFDAYLSDPAHPVPYRTRPILPTWGRGSTWATWLVDDQRFVQDRLDVAAWEGPTLADDVVLAGDISAHLFAATTGSDADWVVKLIDVYPENDAKLPGYQLMVSNEVFRGRYRTSFEHPQAIVPNHTDEYTIDLHTQSYRFLKGHKIRVQVQSTWFPLIDRNPQTFVPNIFKAKDTDFKAATMRIYRSAHAASYVELPIAAGQSAPAVKQQGVSSDSLAGEVLLTPASTKNVQLGINFGLLQLGLGGFNVAGELRSERLWLEYSHGMHLTLNNLGGFGLTQAERDQNLHIRVPFTTGFGVGVTLVNELWLGAEFKAHGYEVNAPGGRVANYRTYSIGPVLGYKYYIWKGLFADAYGRYWPNVATSLDGGKIALAGPNGTVEHTAHDFGLFANVSVGYMFRK